MKLKDKVALITGGAQGIGQAIGSKFASEGAHIVVSDVVEELAQKTADEFQKKYNVQTLALKSDVTKFADCEQMAEKALAKLGHIDILVNNAGITKDNLVMRMSDEEWDAVLAVNLKGAFNCTKAVIRPMMKNKTGRIINICSIV